jgi:hypothetical protein
MVKELDMYLVTLCALLLILSIASFWIFRRRIYGFGIYLLSLGFAYSAGLVSLLGILTLASLLIGFVLVNNPHLPKKVRPFGYLILLAVGLALSLHIAPGFRGWEILAACQASPLSIPFDLCFNFDKVSLGIFILTSGVPLCHQGFEWKKALHVAAVFAAISAITLAVVALTVGFAHFEFKLPAFTPLWIVINLFFVATIEEVIVRSFVQEKLSIMSRSLRWHYLISLTGSSFVFSLSYYSLGPRHVLLAFIAGFFFGGAYIASKRRVEASILTHFFVNLIHLIGFTYPALST